MQKNRKKNKYNILVWGESIVEHAILKKLSISQKVNKFYSVEDFKKEYVFSSSYVNDYKMTKEDINSVIKFAKSKEIDIFICDWSDNTQGIVDVFETINISIVGVNQKWSKLEAYKHIGKNFMQLNDIKTAPWTLIETKNEFLNNINNYGYPVVVKANGPASGLGVYICETKKDAITAFKKLKSGRTYPIQKK